MPQRQHETCTVPGCTRRHKARGYCQAHYQHHQRGVPIRAEIKARDVNPPEHCTEEGCTSPVKSRGLCFVHYQRLLRHGHTKYRDRKKPAKPCAVEDCSDHVYAKGLCHKHYIRRRNMARKYGTTPEQMDEIISAQGGLCPICQQEPRKVHGLSGKVTEFCVDHDHSTGQIRGMLCDHCNRALGLFGDSPERLRAAAAYIERHRAT